MEQVDAAALLSLLLEEDQEDIRSFRQGMLPAERWVENQRVRLMQVREVLTHFFPTKEKFGDEGYKSAFILVLHSEDVPLMEYYLARHQKESPENVDRSSEAFLIDKILIQTGKNQRYGTQFKRKGDRTIEFLPIEDEPGVDERRSALGLSSLQDYKKYAEEA